jgi:ABC-type lipoprotein release transport system permease subunit
MTSFLARLAWRNLWRHARRTQLLLAVVAYATLAIIFFWGFFDGFVDMLISSQARYLAAPVRVEAEAHLHDPDPENALADLGFMDDLANVEGVRAVAPRLELPALLRSPYRTRGAQVRGIDPAAEPAVSDLPQHIGGAMLSAPGQVVLGADLAAELDVRLGERLAIDAQSLAGSQGLGLRVVGLIDAGVSSVDEAMVWIHLDDARALTGVPTATSLALDVASGRERAVAARAAASGVLPEGVAARGIVDQLSGIMAGIDAKRANMVPMILLFAIFAAITVMSTVVVSVIERTREFGVMTSLGLPQARIARMVMLEAGLTAGLGFGLGALLGFGLNGLLTLTNAMGPLIKNVYSRFLEGYALTDELLVAMQVGYLAWAATTVALAALLAIAVPGRRIRALEPAEAMRA